MPSKAFLQADSGTRYNIGYGEGFNDGFNHGLEAAESIAVIVLASLILQVFARNIVRHDGSFVIEILDQELLRWDIGHRRAFQMIEATAFAIQITGVALIFVVTFLGVDAIQLEVTPRP